MKKQYIKKFCAETGEIILQKDPEMVEQTAAAELKKFLGRYHFSGNKKLIVGRAFHSDEIFS